MSVRAGSIAVQPHWQVSVRPFEKETVLVSATVRDIAIILVAIEILVMNALLIVLVWQVWRLIKMIRAELKPVIKDGQETVGTVKGSAEFVSESFISPLISASSRLAGIRRSAQVIKSELEGSMGAVAPSQRRSGAADGDNLQPEPEDPPSAS